MLNQMYPARKNVLNDEKIDTGMEMAERKPTEDEIKQIVRGILNELGSSIPKNAEPAYYSEDKTFGPEEMSDEFKSEYMRPELPPNPEFLQKYQTDKILKMLNRPELGSANRKPYSEEIPELDENAMNMQSIRDALERQKEEEPSNRFNNLDTLMRKK